MWRKICIWICALNNYVSCTLVYVHFIVCSIYVCSCSTPSFSSPSFSSPANSTPANFVRHFPVLQIPPLRLRPSFSSPANSTPATSSVIFQSCKFSYPPMRTKCTCNHSENWNGSEPLLRQFEKRTENHYA